MPHALAPAVRRAWLLVLALALALGVTVVPAREAAASGTVTVNGVTISSPEVAVVSARVLRRTSTGTVSHSDDETRAHLKWTLQSREVRSLAGSRLALHGADGTLVVAGQASSVRLRGTATMTAALSLASGEWTAVPEISFDGVAWLSGAAVGLHVGDGAVTTTEPAPAPSPSTSTSPTTSPSPSPSPTTSPSPSPSPTTSPSPSPSPSTSPSPSPSPTTSPSPSPSPNPAPTTVSSSVHSLGWFYRPPVGSSLEQVAATNRRYILTKLDEPTREGLKARGAQGPFLQYLRFEAIMDDTGLGYQWHNQVAWKPGDWANISANHPDWFLLDSQGRRMQAGHGDASETRFYLMDPMNAGWREFFVRRMNEMQTAHGWDGVFLDNVELSLAKRQRTGQTPAKYPNDATYVAAVRDFLAHLRTQYFQPTGRPVEANLIEQRHHDDPAWHDMLSLLDGGMREGWVAGWDYARPQSEWGWTRELAQAEKSLAAGKHLWLVDVGNRNDSARQQFSYASYLLIANGRASYRYTDPSRYAELWSYANYQTDLGAPRGARYKVGNAWHRDFERGTVKVDPVAVTSAITLR